MDSVDVEIFIFRHGETDWNAQERFQGHIDIPLNSIGRKQAKTLIPILEKATIQAILSSDLIRALETARIVAEGLGIKIYQDAALREAFLGRAQGLTRVEIEAQFGAEVASRWRSSHVSDADVAYPGGETGAQIMSRVFAALEKFVLQNPEYSKIGVATHGGVIRRIMQKLLPPGSPSVPIPNGVLYRLAFNRKTRAWIILD